MNNQPPTRAAIRAIFIAMLIAAVLIALIATFLPSYVDLDDKTAMMMRIVFYVAAVLSVGQAFWVKAKLTKHLPPEERKTGERKTGERKTGEPKTGERKSGGTVQRQ
jgi:FtsH-binding integral membrane protein